MRKKMMDRWKADTPQFTIVKKGDKPKPVSEEKDDKKTP